MAATRFSATIQIRGVNPYVAVSKARASAIKSEWRKPMPVLVRIDGKPKTPHKINMMPAGGGAFYLYLHGGVRKASSTKVGDRVRVAVEFDSKYRGGPEGPMPPWFKAALTRKPAAMRNWKLQAPSRQKEILRYLSRLKSPEAQARNVKRAMDALSGKTHRFLSRT